MAKTVKSSGTSRIKFIMLDAEIADDQIQSVTQAIANALRPVSPPAAKRIAAEPPHLNGNGAAEEGEQSDLFEALEEDEVVDVTPAKSRVRKVAKSPELLPIDFNAFDVPLASFVADYRLESDRARFMVTAVWFQEHGGVTKITPSHIYSAYRWLKWNLVKDFSQPLRDLKKDQLFTSSEKGTYTPHHVLLQRVAELKHDASPDAAK